MIIADSTDIRIFPRTPAGIVGRLLYEAPVRQSDGYITHQDGRGVEMNVQIWIGDPVDHHKHQEPTLRMLLGPPQLVNIEKADRVLFFLGFKCESPRAVSVQWYERIGPEPESEAVSHMCLNKVYYHTAQEWHDDPF